VTLVCVASVIYMRPILKQRADDAKWEAIRAKWGKLGAHMNFRSSASEVATLHLGGKRVNSIPPEIGDFTNLKILWLHDNKLTDLPPELGDLSNLTRLTLHNNQLETRQSDWAVSPS
jgi:Leucine-rich repeat (LRR) protein